MLDEYEKHQLVRMKEAIEQGRRSARAKAIWATVFYVSLLICFFLVAPPTTHCDELGQNCTPIYWWEDVLQIFEILVVIPGLFVFLMLCDPPGYGYDKLTQILQELQPDPVRWRGSTPIGRADGD